MARLVFGMNQSLDGYVDHDSPAFASSAPLFQHYIEQTRGLAASLYGRRLYELMRYWDVDGPAWGEAEHAFAAAWRGTPKWVVSSALKSLGPNARLLEGDLATAVRQLKDRLEGEIEVGGPVLAGSLTELGLIDEYRLYVHPVVLGQGAPFFTGPRPPLRLLSSDRIDGSILRLAYVPV